MSITRKGLRLLLNKQRFFKQTACYSDTDALAKPPEHKENAVDTHFGCEQVREKTQKVYEVIENVAKSYDVMNDAKCYTFGVHRLWKDVLVCKLGPKDGTKLLDVACGTGDIAFRFLDYAEYYSRIDCHVTVMDINDVMLKVGQERLQKLNLDKNKISWKQGNAEELPFENDTFNAYTIAFGIRKCTHIDKVIREAYRVLKPGGRFLCLEFGQLSNSNMQWLYDQYDIPIIPVMGQSITGLPYLGESIGKFPNEESFKEIMEQSGFREVTYENYTMDIVAIHSGFKL